MNGFLVIDKPAGWTSFDVVAKVRNTLKGELKDKSQKIKVGHAGTLDPFATGVLVLAIGKATKQIEQVMGQKKTYRATIKLGATTNTLDPEGEETFVSDIRPSEAEVLHALRRFEGSIEQMPPQFSALKVDGKRAYDLAREGKVAKLQPRNVIIHSLKLLRYQYPDIELETEVSKGTYIRSLARDIGEELKVGGYCTQLRRTQVGSFGLDGALKPTADAQELLASLIQINTDI